MAKRVGGGKRKSRYKFTKERRAKGKISLTRYLQELKEGDKVSLCLEPAVQEGFYCPRFMGKTGIVAGRQGRCYRVTIMDKDKEKTLVIHPVHLKKVGSAK